jgi:hypothetical protein
VDTIGNVSFYELLLNTDYILRHNISKVMTVVGENYKTEVHKRLFCNSDLLKSFFDTRSEDILLSFLG